jgi:hypothetical protein
MLIVTSRYLVVAQAKGEVRKRGMKDRCLGNSKRSREYDVHEAGWDIKYRGGVHVVMEGPAHGVYPKRRWLHLRNSLKY